MSLPLCSDGRCKLMPGLLKQTASVACAKITSVASSILPLPSRYCKGREGGRERDECKMAVQSIQRQLLCSFAGDVVILQYYRAS